MSNKTHEATFYVQVQRKKHPQYRSGKGYVSASAIKLTQDKPSVTTKDTVAVKLTIELPDSAFEPFEPSAVVAVPSGMTQKPIHIIVEDPS